MSSVSNSSASPFSDSTSQEVERVETIKQNNRATKATYHPGYKGIHLVLKDGTTLELRLGTVLQCDLIQGGTVILQVRDIPWKGPDYDNPIGFGYLEWSKYGWSGKTVPLGLWPGCKFHVLEEGFDLNTMKLCDHPNGLSNPVYSTVERLDVALHRIEEARQRIASGVPWTELNLKNLMLTKLPPIPEGVYNLNLDDNQLTRIDTLPDSLCALTCTSNYLESLPSSLPPALRSLDCSWNRLRSIPALPSTLVFLDCSLNRRLKSLPPLDHLVNLVELYCGGNCLKELPPFSSNKLQRIWCSTNNIERLPPLKHLTALKQLRCGENQLKTIPELPDTVHVLNCGQNQLSALPPLPKHMVELRTGGNLVDLGYINNN
jgi:hypothetical protein